MKIWRPFVAPGVRKLRHQERIRLLSRGLYLPPQYKYLKTYVCL